MAFLLTSCVLPPAGQTSPSTPSTPSPTASPTPVRTSAEVIWFTRNILLDKTIDSAQLTSDEKSFFVLVSALQFTDDGKQLPFGLAGLFKMDSSGQLSRT